VINNSYIDAQSIFVSNFTCLTPLADCRHKTETNRNFSQGRHIVTLHSTRQGTNV